MKKASKQLCLLSAPEMPEEYLGVSLKQCKYKNTSGRKWTPEEESWIIKLKKEGYGLEEIATSVSRDSLSVSIKIKRLSKINGDYNFRNIDQKYKTNADFIEIINPKTVLDVFAGNSWYNGKVKVVTNDIDEKKPTDYHMESLSFVCQQYLDKKKYDIVDLDPFGSAYDCFDLAIKMANKGLIVTFGEFGHLRFKRLDFVRERYNINLLSEFIPEKFIEEIIRFGKMNKKKMIPIFTIKYGNIIRVYFKIERLLKTEQWERDSV